MKKMTPDDPRHGTVNGYVNLGCREACCRAAWNEAHKRYMDAHPEQREKAKARERARRNRLTVVS